MELGRRERKRQAIHQGLLAAAASLFAERGLARTTVDEIAEAADVARQTVFNHFPYKEVFALELAASSVDAIATQSHALLEAGSPALDVLRRAAFRVLAEAVQQGERAAVVAQELLHPDLERSRRAAERVPISRLFEAILVQAREEGTVREELPLDIVAERLCAIVASVTGRAGNLDPSVLHRDLAVCFDVLLNGISERST